MKVEELLKILLPLYKSYEICVLINGIRISITEDDLIEDEETHTILIDL